MALVVRLECEARAVGELGNHHDSALLWFDAMMTKNEHKQNVTAHMGCGPRANQARRVVPIAHSLCPTRGRAEG